MSRLALPVFAAVLSSFVLTPALGAAQSEGDEAGMVAMDPADYDDEQVPEEQEPEEQEPEEEATPLPPVEEVQLPVEEPDDAEEGSDNDMAEYAGQLRQRAEMRSIHRVFGIATWVSMLGTAVLGFIQYSNLYGFFGGVEDTPCVQGNAIFGQDQCWGVPWPHRIGWITTTALYTATFALSFMMPDPDHLADGQSDFAQTLSLHKTLRWVHFAGMLAQIFLGLATAQNWFGIDRANDFGAQQALASVHQLIGWGTLGVLTAAGAIMLF